MHKYKVSLLVSLGTLTYVPQFFFSFLVACLYCDFSHSLGTWVDKCAEQAAAAEEPIKIDNFPDKRKIRSELWLERVPASANK